MERSIVVIILISLLSSRLFGDQSLTFLSKTRIDQKNAVIEFSSDIALGHDFYIISDSKAGDIKLVDSNGNIYNRIGRKGQGPGEFFSPFRLSFVSNTLYVYDFSNSKLSLFSCQNDRSFDFVDSYTVGGALNFEVYEDIIYIDGNKRVKEAYYDLYSLTRSGDHVDYWLPSYKKYGLSSQAEYIKVNSDLVKIGPFSYIHSTQEKIYSIWEGNLSIIEIDKETKDIRHIGLKSDSYSRPSLTKRWRDYHSKRGMGHIVQEEKRKFSYVTGIIGDADWIGIVIKNYNESKEAWYPILLIVDLETKNIREFPLATVHYFNTGPIPHDYSRYTKELIILSSVLNGDDIEYDIHKYRIDNE